MYICGYLYICLYLYMERVTHPYIHVYMSSLICWQAEREAVRAKVGMYLQLGALKS